MDLALPMNCFSFSKDCPKFGTAAIKHGAQINPPQNRDRFMRRLGRDIVHIKVGENLIDFGIHKDLLCSTSPFFRAAFRSGFEESQTGIMKLSSADLDAFEHFVSWLYTDELGSGLTTAAFKPAQGTLIELYIFADMIRVPRLKNTALRKLYHLILYTADDDSGCVVLDPETVCHVWENTVESSMLRKMLVDICVWRCDRESPLYGYGRDPDRIMLPPAFCMDVLRGMNSRLHRNDAVVAGPLTIFHRYEEPLDSTDLEDDD